MSENKTKQEIEIEEEELNTITLEYDDGVVMEAEILGVFESGAKDYIALMPDDGSDDVYIYGYKELDNSEDEFELVDIEDENEFATAVDTFEKLMEAEAVSNDE